MVEERMQTLYSIPNGGVLRHVGRDFLRTIHLWRFLAAFSLSNSLHGSIRDDSYNIPISSGSDRLTLSSNLFITDVEWGSLICRRNNTWRRLWMLALWIHNDSVLMLCAVKGSFKAEVLKLIPIEPSMLSGSSICNLFTSVAINLTEIVLDNCYNK